MKNKKRRDIHKMTFKELRVKAGLKQNDIEKALNLKSSAISKWESGNSVPRIKDMPKLAAILNVTTQEILDCFQNAS